MRRIRGEGLDCQSPVVGPGQRDGVQRLAVERHPPAELIDKRRLVVIGLAMSRQWDIEQQVAVLADHVNQKMNHRLWRAVLVVFENRTAVMPAADTGVGLPW